MIQHAEDALSHSIALKVDVKHPLRMTKAEGDKVLAKYRSYTLGQAINRAKKESLFSAQLLSALDELLVERNWLIHKSIAHGRDEWELNPPWGDLFKRIKGISTKAQMLQRLIEEDMFKFSEANGVDMSGVRAEMEKWGQT